MHRPMDVIKVLRITGVLALLQSRSAKARSTFIDRMFQASGSMHVNNGEAVTVTLVVRAFMGNLRSIRKAKNGWKEEEMQGEYEAKRVLRHLQDSNLRVRTQCLRYLIDSRASP